MTANARTSATGKRVVHAGGRPYVLAGLALIIVIAAAMTIIGALGRMQEAAEEITWRAKVSKAAEQILSIARDSETGQRGYLLTGHTNYLQPYFDARRRAPAAWQAFDAFDLDLEQRSLRNQIRAAFDAKFAHNARTLAAFDEGNQKAALEAVQSGRGKQIMDRMRMLVARFQAHEVRGLAAAERRSAAAKVLATVLTLVSALALAASGALMFAAVRRARADAETSADRATSADQRFRATFEQAGVGMMHIDGDGYPILVNDTMCAMTGYSRAEFLAATPESPAMPSNLFSNKDRCEALLGGEVQTYHHERLTQAKDGREIYLSSDVSSVRDADGNILFLSAIISDQTDRYRAERDLQISQERLRRLQDEFAHVARVNDMGEMAAAIAHEVNQPLTAITNYMSVANKLAAKRTGDGDLPEVLQRASEQALRAGQIVKRMRGFVERTEEVREVERVDTLIDSAIEMTMIGFDRDKVDITHLRAGDTALVRVDPIQFQQVLIILMRNAIEAYSSAHLPGTCQIEVATNLDAQGRNVIVDVSDNGPGLPADAEAELFKPFVTSKPGNMGMGLSIARRLMDSHGGRLTVQEPIRSGATFRITIPLVLDDLDQAA